MAPVAVSTAPAVDPIEALKAGIARVKVADVEAADLSQYAQFNTSPSIGTEFRAAASTDSKPVLDIRDVLNDESKLKALGRLVSERGVVFFRNAVISADEQKFLVDRLGVHGGKPATSGLHVHPLTLLGTAYGDEISLISNKFVFSDKFQQRVESYRTRPIGKRHWHSDITFEAVPSDYASLQIRKLPENGGGDTLWASAYDAYDRLSPTLQKFLEGLTAVHRGQVFIDIANKHNAEFREPRGAPENVGQSLETEHPVIRTNPVTGWKGLFVNKGFTRSIVGLTEGESDALLAFLFEHVSANHDIQTRFRWEENSLAIWDNRSTYVSSLEECGDVADPAADVDGDLREGTRSVSLGERPYFDPQSVSRIEALSAQKA